MNSSVNSPVDPFVGTAPGGVPAALRKLYFVRFAFAAVWAALLFATADTLGPVSVTLLVIYPLFDVAAAVVDLRAARAEGVKVPALLVNIVVSSLTVIGLAVAATSGIPAVLRVWGAWAVLSGVVQLVAGAVRRKLGGQWPMIISGAISTLMRHVVLRLGRRRRRLTQEPRGLRLPRRPLLPHLSPPPEPPPHGFVTCPRPAAHRLGFCGAYRGRGERRTQSSRPARAIRALPSLT